MFVTRFAPSPTGWPHRGHAFSALTAEAAARAAGGRFLLRLEDIDAQRCRPEYAQAFLDDLTWLGLTWETPPRRQSQHLDDYSAALARLREQGLVYRCFRTRAALAREAASAPHGPQAPFFGAPLSREEEAARLARGEPFAWRLSATAALAAAGPLRFHDADAGWVEVTREACPDVILARKDVGVAYHLAVVVDDALQGVTQVIRGEDLRDATPVQRLLQAVLGLPSPTYRHHRLLLRPDGKRFAKRDTAETLRDLRARGVSPAALRAALGFGG